jgi:tetratricopeptide (TPR) repeat protein
MQQKSNIESVLSQARMAFQKNQYDSAISGYEKALQKVDNEKEKAIVWAELSWAYYKSNDYEHAVEAAERVISSDPSYSARDDLFRVAGYAHLALNHASLAEKYLSESIAANATADKQQYVKFELGKLYFSQGNYDLAYPYFKDIEDFFSADGSRLFSEYLVLYGICSLLPGKYGRVRRLF